MTVDSRRATCEDSRVLFSAGAADPDGDTLTYAWVFSDGYTSNLAAFGRLMLAGEYSVSLTVSDSVHPAVGDGPITFESIGDPDCCPVLDPSHHVVAMEGQFAAFQARAADFEGTTIVYTATSPVPYGSYFGPTGMWTWQTGPGDAGDYEIHLTASDGSCTVAATLTIEILPPPIPPDERDTDLDGIQDLADNCASVANHDQEDADRDGVGDHCDLDPIAARIDEGAANPQILPGTPDRDLDGVGDGADVCPDIPDHDQADIDRDHVGDACDPDLDGDGIAQLGDPDAYLDNCPVTPNADQADLDQDGIGNACQKRLAAAAALATGTAAGQSTGSGDDAVPVGAKLMMLAAPTALVAGLGLLAIVLGRRRNKS